MEIESTGSNGNDTHTLILDEVKKNLQEDCAAAKQIEQEAKIAAIDARLADIKREQEELFPNHCTTDIGLKREYMFAGRGNGMDYVLHAQLRIAPKKELDNTLIRIEQNACYYTDACENLEIDTNGILALEYVKEISSDEWRLLLDFAALAKKDDFAGSTGRFHSALETIDGLLDNGLGVCALEMLAILRRVNRDFVANKFIEGRFDQHLYYAGQRIYQDFKKNPKDYQNLTAWQYETLLDSAAQYAMDLSEEIQKKRTGSDGDEIYQRRAAENKAFEESAKKAETIRKENERKQLKAAHQGIINCIANHYIAKAREEAGAPKKEALMESFSNA
ncbi:hypothetical protein KY340_03105 [Candidatus Woesearchaeota archaeon]|nr:hypothetical protein [Candidatus Woesearchaeota archaeon]